MTDHTRIVEDFVRLWSKRDLDAILAAMSEDCVYHNMPWAPLHGRAQIREALQAFVGRAAEIDWVIIHIAETKTGAVLTERLDRFLIDGTWAEVPVMGTFELRDGKIAAWRDYFDSIAARDFVSA